MKRSNNANSQKDTDEENEDETVKKENDD